MNFLCIFKICADLIYFEARNSGSHCAGSSVKTQILGLLPQVVRPTLGIPYQIVTMSRTITTKVALPYHLRHSHTNQHSPILPSLSCTLFQTQSPLFKSCYLPLCLLQTISSGPLHHRRVLNVDPAIFIHHPLLDERVQHPLQLLLLAVMISHFRISAPCDELPFQIFLFLGETPKLESRTKVLTTKVWP